MEQNIITPAKKTKASKGRKLPTLKTSTAFFFLSLILLSSCSKKDDAKNTSKKDLLTAAPWKMVAAVVNPPYNIDGTGEVSDYFSLNKACEKDDLFLFKANGDLVFDEGATKCDASDPQSSIVGKWELRNNDTEIYAEGINDKNLVQLLELTESSLKVKWSETEDNVNYTYQESFTH